MTADSHSPEPTAHRIATSVLTPVGHAGDLGEFFEWFREFGSRVYTRAETISIDDLSGWYTDPETGNIRHQTGKFFTVEGLEVEVAGAHIGHWSQPIIRQPEIGILGTVVREIDGVLHFLMQAKVEPGNPNGLQLSPTVQATRSNYTGVHQGRTVPYVEYFRDPANRRVLVDVRQSEQGSWFHQKRNRNMVVEVTEEIEVLDGFRWLTLGQIHQLLAMDDVVNMDSRTVLACMPFAGPGLAGQVSTTDDGFGAGLLRSCAAEARARHTMDDNLSWITEARVRHQVSAHRINLPDVKGWHRDSDRISHEGGLYFDVIGVRVTANGREVTSWDQPMIRPKGTGVIAFLVKNIDGVLHALVHARVEAGFFDVVELGPTVQCTPENYVGMPSAAAPRFLHEVVRAGEDRVRYATTLSEEGGRFFYALNRYQIIETELDVSRDDPDYRWMTVHQLTELAKHSHYLNIQARSLVACLHSLFSRAAQEHA
jgi:dTDP-4-dehydro-6-deoxy-alpha-D-glucopyranose 2,3-dehydratase